MDLRHVHLYRDDFIPNLDANLVAADLEKLFPNCLVDVRDSFQNYLGAAHFSDICDQTRISDIKQPFGKQPKGYSSTATLYDGFELQRVLRSMISETELDSVHLHIVLTDLLTCTFDENDWRYHARAVICGSPSIVSCSGIVEGPAKPREYYIHALPSHDPQALQKEFAGRFIGYGDSRLTAAMLLYSVQAIYFFLADGEPFCENATCRLYNAHWQEELIMILANPVFCDKHIKILNKFNALSDVKGGTLSRNFV